MNLLSIPFKKSYATNVKDAARSWLQTHSTAHPDAFRTDINRWQELRNDGVGGVVHVDRIDSTLKYHAQLTSILTKLPPDIHLDIAYAPAFSPSGLPVTLRNLVFERASVVFNLAALYSQLAELEDRSHIDGIKRAISYYQLAAGSMSFLRASVLPKFASVPEDERPLDLSTEFVHTLEKLMLAQAQECFWQKARLDNFKNGLMARLAANAASLYQLALTTVKDSPASVRTNFPSQWLSHIEAKWHHFDAVAQYRKSLDEFEASKSDTTKYGFEIARLTQSQLDAQKAYDVARRGKVHTSVVEDAQSLLTVVRKSLTRAERDNDLIYHQEVPAPSALPSIAHAAIAQPTVPVGLTNPTSLIEQNDMILGELLGWGAQEAINIYNDRKKTLIEEKIDGTAEQIKEVADSTLRSLNLPASLEALERPVGLPPSLLRKAEEVRLETGPARIESALEDLQRLAQENANILNEAMDILDNEASEDENFRKDILLDRLPSHEANVEFIEKQERYRGILDQAHGSDDTVRQKWDDWEKNIVELTWDEPELEASVPASTSDSATPGGAETQKHATFLRKLLESLDSLERDCTSCVRRAHTIARADNIQPRILRAASGLERLVGVEPAMFADVSDEELAKYDRFIIELEELGTKQQEILASIKNYNNLFLQSRKEDPSVKEREHALQSLEFSYHKYREILHNVQEGIKFYNDLAILLTQFKESCKVWSQQRKQEIYNLSRTINHKKGNSVPTAMSPSQSKSGLPSIDSADWGFEDLLPIAPPGQATKQRK